MTEKIPPVLSDEELLQRFNVGRLGLGDWFREVIKAQRDADVAYYEDIFAGIQDTQEALVKKLDDVELAIQQAKAEVAREIIGKLIREGADKTFAGEQWWQALKSKYAEGKTGFTDEELKDLHHHACDDTIG